MHFNGLLIYNNITLEFHFSNNTCTNPLLVDGKPSKGWKSVCVPHQFSHISMEMVTWLPPATIVTHGITVQWSVQL